MLICPRCATHLKPGSAVCPACGAVPLASIQKEQDTSERISPPDFSPRVRARNLRSSLPQTAGAWGFLAGVGLCVLAAIVHGGSFGDILLYGCMLLALVAPCAGLLGILAFSAFADAGQQLFRPIYYLLNPWARGALRTIKEAEIESSFGDESPRQSDMSIRASNGITNETTPDAKTSEGFCPADAVNAWVQEANPPS